MLLPLFSRLFIDAVLSGGILSILLVTMLFRDYMQRRGRFPEPESDSETD